MVREPGSLQHTPLHDLHVARGAKMVDFGGWHMPLQYEGILAEHKAVREAVGIFDVSHMGEIDFTGPGALAAVQRLITNDAAKLVDGRAMYTCVCYPDGGIVDDCIVYRESEGSILIVINAANPEKDIAWFRASLAGRSDVEFTDLSAQTGLIAVQGPRAAALLDKLAPGDGFSALKSFHFKDGTVAGVRVWAARTGYTGEDGFELFVPADVAVPVWQALLAAGAAPIGLGARDTLRLEAGLCLYGHDITTTTTPVSVTTPITMPTVAAAAPTARAYLAPVSNASTTTPCPMRPVMPPSFQPAIARATPRPNRASLMNSGLRYAACCVVAR